MNTKQQLGRSKRAKKNLALKLLLEQRFNPEINAYFNKIVQAFRTFYIATGSPIRPDTYSDETVSLLRKQYVRVSNLFKREMREEGSKLMGTPKSLFKQEDLLDEGLDEEQSAILAVGLSILIARQSKVRGRFIDETTQRDINNSIREAQLKLDSDGEERTRAKIAVMASLILKKKFKGRKNTISASETQFMAEKTKASEVNVLANGNNVDLNNIDQPTFFSTEEAKKQWAAIFDDVTRPAHVLADGQTKVISDPFIVGGERLKEPGDTSLGASPGNTINCRCSALYGITK